MTSVLKPKLAETAPAAATTADTEGTAAGSRLSSPRRPVRWLT